MRTKTRASVHRIKQIKTLTHENVKHRHKTFPIKSDSRDLDVAYEANVDNLNFIHVSFVCISFVNLF